MLNCPDCAYQTENKYRLKQHYKVIHEKTGETFSCRECDYVTHYQGNLTKHVQIRHDPNFEGFKCDYCDYKTLWKNSLLKHINSIHTQKISYSCWLIGLCQNCSMSGCQG